MHANADDCIEQTADCQLADDEYTVRRTDVHIIFLIIIYIYIYYFPWASTCSFLEFFEFTFNINTYTRQLHTYIIRMHVLESLLASIIMRAIIIFRRNGTEIEATTTYIHE